MSESISGAIPPLAATIADEADVQEQAETVDDIEVSAGYPSSVPESLEVDEFDAAEQGRQVDLDPDEYR